MYTATFLTLFSLAAARGLPPRPSHSTITTTVTTIPTTTITTTPLPATTADMVPFPTSFPITEPCIALTSYQGELNNTRTSITTKKAAMQALTLKQKLCHGCLTHEETDKHGKLDWDVQQLIKLEIGQLAAVKCLEWMCGAGGIKDGHEGAKEGWMIKECVVLE